MSYKSVMVSVVPGRDNAGIVATAMEIARSFGATLRGRAACRPIHSVCRDYTIPAGLFEEDRKQIQKHLRESEDTYRKAVAGYSGPIDWKGDSCMESLAEHLAEEAAAADIVVAGMEKREGRDETRQPDLCDLVMQAGRPVLLVPTARPTTDFNSILVAWKSSREARRAVADALPLLKRAGDVSLVEIVSGDDHGSAHASVARVAGWLTDHGIKAQTKLVASNQANASQLSEIARDSGADLIVAGAYGYNRQGRWVLGGVTTELLEGDRCALLSH